MAKSNERIIRHKLGLLNLAEELGNVARPCRGVGVSRDTSYRHTAEEDGGVEALLDLNRRKPNPKNRADSKANIENMNLRI